MQNNKHKVLTALTLFMVMMLSSCGGGYKKSPLDQIIRDLPNDQVFSVVLYDMDVEGSFIQQYMHQYQIISENARGEIDDRTTDWYEVSEKEFNQYINDMGMEIAARDSTGKLSKSVAPPGYNNYVGNPKYGYWNNSGGSSFWAFYGQYAMLSSLFRMASYPVRRSYYDDWSGNYRGRDRRYYGPSGSGGRYYGTGSRYSRSSNPTASWNNRSRSFQQQVSQRVSRSSSRSSSSSSARSRGGSFGK
ncbi:MAG: hypothetical protein AAGC88_05895 [Bacteroidota bacterium]